MEELHGSSSTSTNNQGSITTTISDNLRKDLNADEDIVKRKDGAEKFGKFTEIFERILLNKKEDEELAPDENIRELSREAIYHAVMPEKVVLGLQALFLQEKPAIWGLFSDTSLITHDQKEAAYQLLRNYGFAIEEDFIYNPKLVQEVIKKYPEVFGNVDIADVFKPRHWEKYMFKRENDMRLGLLLGYPLEACKGYKKFNELSSEIMNNPENLGIAKHIYYQVNPNADRSKKLEIQDFLAAYKKIQEWAPDRVTDILRELSEMEFDAEQFNANQEDKNVYGFTFVPYNAGEETKALRERLRKAFHESGVLKIWNPLKNKSKNLQNSQF